VIAAAWFGIGGGILAALTISVLVLPYVFGSDLGVHDLAVELVEIVFYFAIGTLAGALFQRELRARKKAENMRLQLERSQKMSLVGQIAAGMAHEIKNPLASIKGAVEILSDESTAVSERDEFRGIVFKEIRRVNNSLTDFLEFARPSETKLSQVDLSGLVRSCLTQVALQAQKNNVRLSGSIEESIVVQADAEKIHQVLLNLIINAIDASPTGDEVITALTRNESDRLVSLTVEDSGPGISKGDLARIFEPFFTTKSSGTGLGLAIAKNIVESHGGTIEIDNRLSGGVQAKVTLPLTQIGEKQ
jgi:signal transduction histidine kinase